MNFRRITELVAVAAAAVSSVAFMTCSDKDGYMLRVFLNDGTSHDLYGDTAKAFIESDSSLKAMNENEDGTIRYIRGSDPPEDAEANE